MSSKKHNTHSKSKVKPKLGMFNAEGKQLLKNTIKEINDLGFEMEDFKVAMFNTNLSYVRENDFCIKFSKEVNENKVEIIIEFILNIVYNIDEVYYTDTDNNAVSHNFINFENKPLPRNKFIEYIISGIEIIEKEIENEKNTQQPSMNTNVNVETHAVAGGKKIIKRTTKKRSSHK